MMEPRPISYMFEAVAFETMSNLTNLARLIFRLLIALLRIARFLA
jgi:hypothetical protein